MATISTLAVNLIARTAVFEKGMRRSRTSMRSLAFQADRSRKRMLFFAKGLIAGGGVVFALKKVITAASDAEEIMSKFNVVFKELGADAKKWSDDFT